MTPVHQTFHMRWYGIEPRSPRQEVHIKTKVIATKYYQKSIHSSPVP